MPAGCCPTVSFFVRLFVCFAQPPRLFAVLIVISLSVGRTAAIVLPRPFSSLRSAAARCSFDVCSRLLLRAVAVEFACCPVAATHSIDCRRSFLVSAAVCFDCSAAPRDCTVCSLSPPLSSPLRDHSFRCCAASVPSASTCFGLSFLPTLLLADAFAG